MLKPEIEAWKDYCQRNRNLAHILLSTDGSSDNWTFSNILSFKASSFKRKICLGIITVNISTKLSHDNLNIGRNFRF